MRRTLPVQWPAHFDLVVRLKGRGAVNDLQVKFVDASGDNVWWVNRPNAALPATLTDVKLRRRHVDFALPQSPTARCAARRTSNSSSRPGATAGGARCAWRA